MLLALYISPFYEYEKSKIVCCVLRGMSEGAYGGVSINP